VLEIVGKGRKELTNKIEYKECELLKGVQSLSDREVIKEWREEVGRDAIEPLRSISGCHN
jgi:hypothetical protein